MVYPQLSSLAGGGGAGPLTGLVLGPAPGLCLGLARGVDYGVERVSRFGEKDPGFDRISGARHATLTRTGHIGLVTRPDRFADLVGQFVDKTAGRTQTPDQPSGQTSDEMMRRPA